MYIIISELGSTVRASWLKVHNSGGDMKTTEQSYKRFKHPGIELSHKVPLLCNSEKERFGLTEIQMYTRGQIYINSPSLQSAWGIQITKSIYAPLKHPGVELSDQGP